MMPNNLMIFKKKDGSQELLFWNDITFKWDVVPVIIEEDGNSEQCQISSNNSTEN